MEMEISFILEAKDVAEFQSYRLKQDYGLKSFSFQLILVAVIISGILYYANQDQEGNFHLLLIFLFIGATIFAIYMYFLDTKMKINRVKKAINCSWKPVQMVMDFEPDYYRVRTENRDRKSDWSKVKKIVETVDYYYIYPLGRNAYIIPKKKISASAEELAALFNKISSRENISFQRSK